MANKKSIPKSPMQQRAADQTRRAMKPAKTTRQQGAKAMAKALPMMTALGIGLNQLNKRRPK